MRPFLLALKEMILRVKHGNRQCISVQVVLCCLALGVMNSACQGGRYSMTLPIVRPHDQQDWSRVDSLIRYDRPCEKYSYGRRIIWVSYWERRDSNSYQVELTKDRGVPPNAIGCTFREGEMVVIIGTELAGHFQMTESKVDFYLDSYEDYAPEDFSLWTMLFVRNGFEILESYPLPCR